VRVSLVNPRWHERGGPVYNRVWMPLSLAVTAALLERDGHDVVVIDAHALGLGSDALRESLTGSDKVFVTSSTLDKWVCPNLDLTPFIRATSVAREVAPQVYGLGVHGTVRPREVLELADVDAVVCGEPELTVRELCREEELRTIAGVAYLRAGDLQTTPARELADVNAFPPPALHLLPLAAYRYEILGDRLVLLEGSRGCPYSCTFCLKAMYGNRYRRKEPDRLLRELDLALSAFGARSVYFMDIEFTLNRRLVEEVCRFLTRDSRDAVWCCQTRVDAVDPDLLNMMRAAGCTLIHFGIESGSPAVLQRIGKRAGIEAMERAVRWARKARIRTACFFLLGLPGEGPEDVEMTLALARRLRPDYVSFHVAVPYPGTAMYDEVRESLGDEAVFPESTGLLPQGELRSLQRRALLSHYLRPSYLARALLRGDLRGAMSKIGVLRQYVRW
jgi:anaerobic magnesium-protoporphyrin IX monomethyl ester cyclase